MKSIISDVPYEGSILHILEQIENEQNAPKKDAGTKKRLEVLYIEYNRLSKTDSFPVTKTRKKK